MHFHKSEGIIIKRFPIQDADWLLTIFTSHYGKITTFAKSSRRITSSRAAKLNLFTRIRFEFIEHNKKNILTHVDIISSYPHTKKHLSHIKYLFIIGELINEFLPENQPHPSVYQLLLDIFLRLPNFASTDYLYQFKLRLLQELGYGQLNFSPHQIDSYIESLLGKSLRTPHIL